MPKLWAFWCISLELRKGQHLSQPVMSSTGVKGLNNAFHWKSDNRCFCLLFWNWYKWVENSWCCVASSFHQCICLYHFSTSIYIYSTLIIGETQHFNSSLFSCLLHFLSKNFDQGFNHWKLHTAHQLFDWSFYKKCSILF